MSRLSELAVAKRSVTLLLAGALFIAGISAWNSLQQELLPDIDFPVITVVAPLPGASATDVASQVAEPIERAISGVPRLENLQSTSANSVALVVAQFSFGTDVKETQAAIEENIASAGLPDSVDADVSALNINASPVVIASIAATNEDGLEAAADIARTEIVPEILGLEGVASADLTGGLEQQVLVTLDPDKLAKTGITVAQISGVLQANDLTLPSGQLTTDGAKVPVSTTGELGSVEAIRDLVVGVKMPAAVPPAPAASPATAGSQAPAASADPGASPAPTTPTAAPAAQPTPVTLGDLGTVEAEGVATTGYARTNGQPALTLTVTKTSTANTVQVAEAVEQSLEEAGARHTDTLTVAVVQDLSTFIKESQQGLLREGGLGALFAVITIFLFLFSLRSTLVAAISIPLSILTALVVMQLAGISLNIMTLGGLAVAVGRVVDDAIVVLENIYRHRALGEDRLTAVTRGPREVAGAITASTLTTVAVFLPLGFVGGLVTQFFLPFSLTVTFALLASLVCALTVVPVLAYLVIDRVRLSVDEHGEPKTRSGSVCTSRRSRWHSATDGRSGRSSASRPRCSSSRSRWSGACRRNSSTRARRRSSRPSSSRPRAQARRPSSTRRHRPRRSSSTCRTSSSSRPASPARVTSASAPWWPPSKGSRRTRQPSPSATHQASIWRPRRRSCRPPSPRSRPTGST